MFRSISTLIALAALGPTAHADPAAEITKRLEAITSKSMRAPRAVPKFAITGNLTVDQPTSWDDVAMGLPDLTTADPAKTLVGITDPDTAWISTQLIEYASCGMLGCLKQASDGVLRATAVVERVGEVWQPLAWSLSESIPSPQQAEAIEQGVGPEPLTRNTAGAEAVATLFEQSIGDPKKLAASYATRPEAVLIGSELGERYAGPAASKQLGAWGFTFKLRDGLRAGLSRSGNVAWVAANVDGAPSRKPKAKPLPYRAFAVYEKTAAGWKLVQLQFSTAV